MQGITELSLAWLLTAATATTAIGVVEPLVAADELFTRGATWGQV